MFNELAYVMYCYWLKLLGCLKTWTGDLNTKSAYFSLIHEKTIRKQAKKLAHDCQNVTIDLLNQIVIVFNQLVLLDTYLDLILNLIVPMCALCFLTGNDICHVI